MLDFVNNYYEVTTENKDTLYQMMIAENICIYSGRELNLNDMHVGYVFGNIVDNNPKRTGKWPSRDYMSEKLLQKVTTKLPIVMVIE